MGGIMTSNFLKKTSIALVMTAFAGLEVGVATHTARAHDSWNYYGVALEPCANFLDAVKWDENLALDVEGGEVSASKHYYGFILGFQSGYNFSLTSPHTSPQKGSHDILGAADVDLATSLIHLKAECRRDPSMPFGDAIAKVTNDFIKLAD